MVVPPGLMHAWMELPFLDLSIIFITFVTLQGKSHSKLTFLHEYKFRLIKMI